ncbi:leucine-rich repeat-containing protein 15-like [Chironomus tepperi]|uniref:leucine-rich repeat-containing protein 15-like n=1 Tax=Chironomus tepperi TaxID=113505 RepID=UPI00391F6C34
MKALICIILSLCAAAHGQIDIPCILGFSDGEYTCRLPQVDLASFDNFIITSANHLPGQSDATIASFVSINNNFQYFPTGHISRFTGLVGIKITGSNITELPPNSIANRPALRRLNLNSNFISQISPQAFTNTVGLQQILLMFNHLTYIDNAVWGLFTNLIELDLSSNLFTTIPAHALQTNIALTALSMNGNQINFINSTFFDNLFGLRTFNFLTNPCYSGQFINLHTVVGRNDLNTRLAPCFTLGPRRLTCSFGTNFQGVNFGVYTCLLRGIEVTNANEQIELGGFHLTGNTNANVEHVWIDASNVRYILSSAFNTFQNLRHLRYQGSHLEYIQPGAFQNATNLNELTIMMNAIRRLEANAFQFATNLRVLNMWFNNLENIDENAFAGLINLQEIHLYDGRLTFLAPNTFAPAPQLRLVEIGFNQLATIDHRWFVQNPLIAQLMFNNNQIDEIFPALVDMPNLTTLRLRNNVCVDNEFTITPANREQVRLALEACFLNYPLRVQRFELLLEGDLELIDEDGRVVVQL